MQTGEKNWYAVYTKPRWEKKVHSLLQERGIEAYCPINRVKKRWSDRTKWVEEPLFKSYVFVRIGQNEQIKVRMTGGVVNFVYWLGTPAVVLDKEIQIIKKFLDEYTDVRAEPLGLEMNERITIQRGVLMNQKAKVIKVMNNKVKVIIESIGYSLVAVIDRTNAVSASR